jgi:undecaprenyl-diphosphatase
MIKPKTIILCSAFLILSLFLDRPVADLVSKIHTPIFDFIMEWASSEVTVVFVFLIMSAVLLYEENKRRFIPVLIISFVASFLASAVFKFLVMRPRPEGIVYKDLFGIGPRVPDYAFPSSHASISFGVLPILDKEFSKIRIFWLAFSILVVFSRIYLNQHYLSDVVAGSIFGYFIGYCLLKAEYKYGIIKGIFTRI